VKTQLCNAHNQLSLKHTFIPTTSPQCISRFLLPSDTANPAPPVLTFFKSSARARLVAPTLGTQCLNLHRPTDVGLESLPYPEARGLIPCPLPRLHMG
jgi:hypothetical protein